MKRDINFKLIGILIFVLVCFLLFLYVYQNRVDFLSKDVSNKSRQLETVTARAVLSESEVTQLESQKNRLESDKSELERLYEEASAELEAAKRDNAVLSEELISLTKKKEAAESALSQKSSDFDILEARFTKVESALIETNDLVSSLSYDFKRVCAKLEGNGGSDDSCE